MTITITGASGFVGQNLSSFLREKEHKVQELSLRTPDWNANINDQGAVLIHLAGKAHDTKNTSDEAEYYKINTDLTKQVFRAFLDSNIRDFFYFSSVKAVADNVEKDLDEEDVAQPETAYGKSKLRAEEYILSQAVPSGKRVFIIRPCMIHGPGNKGNLNLLYKLVKTGIPWPLAAFENKRSFLSIDNLNYLLAAMIDNSQIESGIYNFADDTALSTNEVITVIAEASNKSPRLLKINKSFIGRMANIGDRLYLPLNKERLTKLTENYVVSNMKIKKALDIKHLPLSAKEGLEKTIKSFEKS